MGTQVWYHGSPVSAGLSGKGPARRLIPNVRESSTGLPMNSARPASSLIPDVLLEDFHETGIYEYAGELGMLATTDASPRSQFPHKNGLHPMFSRAPGEASEVSEPKVPRLPKGFTSNSLPSVYDHRVPCSYNTVLPAGVRPSMSVNSGSMGSIGGVSEVGGATPGPSTCDSLKEKEEVKPDLQSPDDNGSKRAKKASRASAADKAGKGLRHFSMKVCEKVESKGRTTYNEVADELVLEFSSAENASATATAEGGQQFDEKNIRRRVYDALNVLMAMDIIAKEKKEIHWKGLPNTGVADINHLQQEAAALRASVEEKRTYLRELQEQIQGTQNLIARNQRLYEGEDCKPPGGVLLPFILVQTKPQATIEVEIAEDMQLVHFDFNNTPFQLFDDVYVLRSMGLCSGGHERGVHQAHGARLVPAQGGCLVRGNGQDRSSLEGQHPLYGAMTSGEYINAAEHRQRNLAGPSPLSPRAGTSVPHPRGAGVTYSFGPNGMVQTSLVPSSVLKMPKQEL